MLKGIPESKNLIANTYKTGASLIASFIITKLKPHITAIINNPNALNVLFTLLFSKMSPRYILYHFIIKNASVYKYFIHFLKFMHYKDYRMRFVVSFARG